MEKGKSLAFVVFITLYTCAASLPITFFNKNLRRLSYTLGALTCSWMFYNTYKVFNKKRRNQTWTGFIKNKAFLKHQYWQDVLHNISFNLFKSQESKKREAQDFLEIEIFPYVHAPNTNLHDLQLFKQEIIYLSPDQIKNLFEKHGEAVESNRHTKGNRFFRLFSLLSISQKKYWEKLLFKNIFLLRFQGLPIKEIKQTNGFYDVTGEPTTKGSKPYDANILKNLPSSLFLEIDYTCEIAQKRPGFISQVLRDFYYSEQKIIANLSPSYLSSPNGLILLLLSCYLYFSTADETLQNTIKISFQSLSPAQLTSIISSPFARDILEFLTQEKMPDKETCAAIIECYPSFFNKILSLATYLGNADEPIMKTGGGLKKVYAEKEILTNLLHLILQKNNKSFNIYEIFSSEQKELFKKTLNEKKFSPLDKEIQSAWNLNANFFLTQIEALEDPLFEKTIKEIPETKGRTLFIFTVENVLADRQVKNLIQLPHKNVPDILDDIIKKGGIVLAVSNRIAADLTGGYITTYKKYLNNLKIPLSKDFGSQDCLPKQAYFPENYAFFNGAYPKVIDMTCEKNRIDFMHDPKVQNLYNKKEYNTPLTAPENLREMFSTGLLEDIYEKNYQRTPKVFGKEDSYSRSINHAYEGVLLAGEEKKQAEVIEEFINRCTSRFAHIIFIDTHWHQGHETTHDISGIRDLFLSLLEKGKVDKATIFKLPSGECGTCTRYSGMV